MRTARMALWKKLLLALTVLVVVFALVLFGGGMLLDGKIELATEKKIAATPAEIFTKLDNVNGLNAWWTSVSQPGMPAMTVRKKSGPDTGRGLAVEFVAEDRVMETWTIKEYAPPTKIVYDVDFAGLLTVERTLTLTPESDASTNVSWRETGNIERPAMRWMKYMTPPEEIVKNFDMALNALQMSVARVGP